MCLTLLPAMPACHTLPSLAAASRIALHHRLRPTNSCAFPVRVRLHSCPAPLKLQSASAEGANQRQTLLNLCVFICPDIFSFSSTYNSLHFSFLLPVSHLSRLLPPLCKINKKAKSPRNRKKFSSINFLRGLSNIFLPAEHGGRWEAKQIVLRHLLYGNLNMEMLPPPIFPLPLRAACPKL